MLPFNNVVVVLPSSNRLMILAKSVTRAEFGCAGSAENTLKMRPTGSAMFALKTRKIFISFSE